jgi:hypothetical protein
MVKLILVDSHVHIYDCFDLEKFFDSAYANFKSAAEQFDHSNKFTGILLLTETSVDNWFRHLSDYAEGKNIPLIKKKYKWKIRHTSENNSLIVESEGSKKLLLIAGRQIATSEGLEILALSTVDNFKDGNPIKKLIADIKDKDGIPVIPWGFGKWLGRRGKILSDLMMEAEHNNFCLGDNGGRPKFLATPFHFKLAKKKGIRIFPGSDPLPFKAEYSRAGSYGFSIFESISFNYPWRDLKNILNKSELFINSYGSFENPFRFLHNQIAMQIRKRSVS